MKHICEHCRYNFKEDGIAVDMSATAVWNEETQRYEFRRSFLDVEIKCTNCYSNLDETVTMLEE